MSKIYGQEGKVLALALDILFNKVRVAKSERY